MHLEFSWVDFGTSSGEKEFLMTGTAMSINNTVLIDYGKKNTYENIEMQGYI